MISTLTCRNQRSINWPLDWQIILINRVTGDLPFLATTSGLIYVASQWV